MQKLMTLLMMTLVLLGLPRSALAKPPLDNPLHDPGLPELAADPTSWSMAGANSQRTSWVSEEVDPSAASNFGVVWYRPIEAYIGQHVQLITARDKVYISTARGVYALDAVTGNEVWRFDTEMPIGHSPTVDGSTLYVGGFDKRVYALDADTGAMIWKFEGATGGFSTNPLVVEGKVMLGSRDGYFYALDQNSGSLVWQYPASNAAPLGPILYSAAYKNGKVFFASNDNYAYALNTSNGSLAWKSNKLPGDGYQAFWPVVYGNYVVFSAALSYAFEADPGEKSLIDVVDPNDPYYLQMYGFQYGADPIKTNQRDDVFHQGEPQDSLLGPQFTSGDPSDTTGIPWSWGSGKFVVDASKVAEYLEDDGQTKVNRPTNKPWRRGVIVLNAANGTEYTLDSDNDGHPEYAPFLFTGTKSGNRYPPIVADLYGNGTPLLMTQNFSQYKSGWGISKSAFMAWEFGTPFVHPVGSWNAVDEPFANSAGGSILYTNLCCDRVANWQNLQTGAGGVFWNYHQTLESIKIPFDQIQSYQKSLAPGYDQMWWDASMWLGLPRLFGNYGNINGLYHNHTIQNPLIPYKGRIFVHRSNGIIALGPNAVSLRQMTANETPAQYEANIRQEYPQVSKPLLPANAPAQNSNAVLTIQDIQSKLDYEISRMLQTGHLRPGYYNGTRGHSELAYYFENPGDTLYTLVQAYPFVSASLKPDLEKYIKQHYKRYFEDTMYARTGYWIDTPTPYDLNDVNGFGQLQPREWMPVPAEVAEDFKGQYASTWVGNNWPWRYAQHNIYAMWLYAKTFYAADQTKLVEIYNKAKNKLEVPAPDQGTLHDKPWIHNAFISGYTGFLNLQNLAGKATQDASLKAAVETELNSLKALRSNDFRKDQPWIGDKISGGGGKIYRRSFNIARNFMNMTPELGAYLNASAFNKIQTAVDEYNRVAPYWVATRYEAAQGEYSSDNLYTHPAMFQAKAYILQEPADQLLKYIDSPAFATGDLFYIQNLVAVLRRADLGFRLEVPPTPQFVDVGGTVQISLQITPIDSFSETISIDVTSSSPTLTASVAPQQVSSPYSNPVILTITDTNSGGSSIASQTYTVIVTASNPDHTKVESKSISITVGSQGIYLPLIQQKS